MKCFFSKKTALISRGVLGSVPLLYGGYCIFIQNVNQARRYVPKKEKGKRSDFPVSLLLRYYWSGGKTCAFATTVREGADCLL